MKTIFALLAILVSTAASAVCFQIYSSSNELVWQNTSPPVSMGTLSINDEVQKIVPKGHMVIVDEDRNCRAFDVTVRKTMRQKVDEIKYD